MLDWNTLIKFNSQTSWESIYLSCWNSTSFSMLVWSSFLTFLKGGGGGLLKLIPHSIPSFPLPSVLFYYSVCSEGVVRLVNQSYSFIDGLSSTGGIVQVCVNQQFGYICGDGWDDREADVVCRSQSSSYQAPYYGMCLLRAGAAYMIVYCSNVVGYSNIYDIFVCRKHGINYFHGV